MSRAIRFAVAFVTLLSVVWLGGRPAQAELERLGYPTDHGIELMWWPKVTPPKGWFQDTQVSMQNFLNMLVPKGKTYENSPAVMYARALYHEKADMDKELASAIESDRKGSLEHDPNSKIAEIAAFATGDGQKLRTFSFTPAGKGNWELVAYGREPDYVLMFCISARSSAALEKYRPAFAAMILSYTSGDGQ